MSWPLTSVAWLIMRTRSAGDGESSNSTGAGSLRKKENSHSLDGGSAPSALLKTQVVSEAFDMREHIKYNCGHRN